MNKLTATILLIHLTLFGLLIGLAFHDANQKLSQFDRSHILTWPMVLMLAWIFYFYLFYLFYVVIGSSSPNKLSAYSNIGFTLLLSIAQVIGFPSLALAIMPADFALKPIVKLMKTHESGLYYKSEKPYSFIGDAEKTRGEFLFKNTRYELSTDGSNIRLCKESTCILLPRISMFEGHKISQFFPRDKFLYISLPNVGIWKIDTDTFEHDINFAENIRKAHSYIDEKDYTGDAQFYLMQLKEDRLILRYGLWVYSTDLDGKNPRPLAFDRANGLEIDN